MALRLIEVIVPSEHAERVPEALGEATMVGPWFETLKDGLTLVRLVIDADETGPVIDRFDGKFGHVDRFQVLIVPVSATLPRLEEPPAMEEAKEESESDKGVRRATGLSREELHQQVRDMMKLSRVYVAMVLLSTVVAALGMIRDNIAVIIGAMVIAPLLGPNVALAFAATIGDTALLRRTILTNIVGITLALALSAACGILLTVDPGTPEVASRTSVTLSDLVLALASGAAGAFAIMTGVPAALVGVMVAVALLPPTVAVGLMIGTGNWSLAGGAMMLLATNIICVNLAGITTFLIKGIRPRIWWEQRQASRWARWSLLFWVAALLVVAALILIRQQYET